MTQVGAPAVGEILADRYRIEEHVNDDSTGRQVWRGVDVILRRAVTIVLRTPGGAEADEMLGAAVAASRVIHPNIVGVYDAIDEGSRAYVVREWVEGRSLRDAVREAPLDPARAVTVARAVADALAAVHATGVSHGNVHPGSVLLSVDDRIVLGDARANERTTPEADVRAVGAVLYCALTGHWPRQIPGPAALPDAPAVDPGRIATPRQVLGGVPAELDELAMDLLNPDVPAPGAAELAVELTRLSYHDRGLHNAGFQGQYQYQDYSPEPVRAGPLGFVSTPDRGPEPEPQPVWNKVLIGVAGLLAIVLVGLLVGTFLSSGVPESPEAAGAEQKDGNGKSGKRSGDVEEITLSPDMVRLVDPPSGDRTETGGIDLSVDGKDDTGWPTQEYQSARFGNLKQGMGLLIDLGKPKKLSAIHLTMSAPDAEVQIRHGDEDFGDSSAGDKQISESFANAGPPRQVQTKEQIAVDIKTRYLLVWITELPLNQGKYQVEIREIRVISGSGS